MAKSKNQKPAHPFPLDPLRLIPELQIFQIELELQAEELHRSQQELMHAKIRYTELYDYACTRGLCHH